MAVLKFRTNAKCGGCITAIGAKLNRIVSPGDWSIDLKDPDKALTVTTDLPADEIQRTVEEAGFKATLIE